MTDIKKYGGGTSQKPTDLEAIVEYYRGERSDLTVTQMARKRRMAAIWAMQTEGHTKKHIVGVIRKEFKVSEDTVYRDCREAVKIYGEVSKADKEGQRYIIGEMAREAYRIAAAAKDVKGMNSAINNLTKIFGLDREDPDTPDFTKLEPSVIVTTVSSDLEEYARQMLKGGLIDLNKIPNIEEIEYETISEGTSEGSKGADSKNS